MGTSLPRREQWRSRFFLSPFKCLSLFLTLWQQVLNTGRTKIDYATFTDNVNTDIQGDACENRRLN